jgi:hypothetical protein
VTISNAGVDPVRANFEGRAIASNVDLTAVTKGAVDPSAKDTI